MGKVNAFYLRSTIGTMLWVVAVDIFTDILDVWV